MPHLHPNILVADAIRSRPALDRTIRERIAQIPQKKDQARWLKHRIHWLMRPGRDLAAVHRALRAHGLRLHHVDWMRVVDHFTYLSAGQFLDMIRRGEIAVRPVHRIQRYAIVSRGLADGAYPDAFAFVSINTENGSLWEDGQAYVADVADTDIDLGDERVVPDRDEVIRAIEDACVAFERARSAVWP